MNFEDIQMTQSYGLRVSNYSRTSQQQSCDPNKSQTRYKCYECGGDTIKSNNCRSCHGLKQVSDNNVMVGLMMQVMCRKLGKDVPTLKNFPKLQFSSQNRIGSKTAKTKFDSRYLNKNKGIDIDKNRRIDPYSEGNSVNESNSLESSLDSLDSSQNSRSNIRSKQKLQKNIGTRYIKMYQNQPNFRQQISQIKQESYATEDYSVCCDKCHKQSDLSSEFMECKICKHYFICMKCYEEKVEQVREGYRQQKQKLVELPQIKREKSAVLIPVNPFTESSEKSDFKNKSCQYKEVLRPEQVNYDNFYQIHEHPLTRYCHPHDSDQFLHPQKERDYVDEQNYHQDDEEQYSTYGGIKKGKNQLGGSPSYKNLFKVYDSLNNECPLSPKKSPPFLDIQVIREQKQSPSPSQKSEVWPVRETESQFDNNISMTISNNFESPESAKLFANKNGSGNNNDSNKSSPININLNNSSNLFAGQNNVNGGAGGKNIDNHRRINLFTNERRYNNQNQNRNQLINHIRINRDTSQWSEYSGLLQNQEPANAQIHCEMNQSNIQIMQSQNQCESRVIQSPDQENEDSKSVKSGKESPTPYQFEEAEDLRREKQKNYTQKKANKFASIRINGEDNKPKTAQKQQKDQQYKQDNRDSSASLPRNLLQSFLAQSKKVPQEEQLDDENSSVEIYPIITLTYQKKPSQLFKQDFKECSRCKKQIMNRSMYMKCQTCERVSKKIYELCDSCFGMRQVINEHNIQNNDNKHTFKAYLYRKSGGMSLDLMDDEEEQLNQPPKPETVGKLNLFTSARSVNIDSLDNSDKKLRDPPLCIHNHKQTESPKEQQLQQQYQYTESEQDEKSYIERQKNYNEQYLKRREKQCQQNEKLKKMYENLIVNSLFMSNRQSVENRERDRISASSNMLSEQYRYSENVGIDGNWLMEPLELERHTSVTCIGPDRENSKPRKSNPIDIPNPDSKPQVTLQQTLNIPQSTVNIITTSNTLISTDKNEKAPEQSNAPNNKNHKNNTSIKLPPFFNIINNCSIDEKAKLNLPERQSPSRQSIVSYKSGSPEKSQMSSRIKVDCGDSQSQFQHHQSCKVEEEQRFQKSGNEQKIPLSKSIRVEKKENNILGQSFAISESQDSENYREEDQMVDQNMPKQKYYSSATPYGYRIITHSIREEKQSDKQQSQENRSRSTEKQDRMRSLQLGQNKQRKKARKSLSKSGSEKDSKKLAQNSGIMMDFLNNIDKSQKLSKSDNEDQVIKQTKQKVHFSCEMDDEIPFENILDQAGEDEQIEYFVFQDYQCDQCGQTPINVRYHCQQCTDFDLCSSCYQYGAGHRHQKSRFEKINKRKQMKLNEQQKKKQSQQRDSILKAIIEKYAPKKGINLTKNQPIRNSLPGNSKSFNNPKQQNLSQSTWRMGHSLKANSQQAKTAIQTKSVFMEKNRQF